jgi:hypothetical protein
LWELSSWGRVSSHRVEVYPRIQGLTKLRPGIAQVKMLICMLVNIVNVISREALTERSAQ